MTLIKFTLKVTDKHNPPAFGNDLDAGVLSEVVIDFKTKEAIPLAFAIIGQKDEMIKDWIEVITEPIEIINDKENF